MSLLYPRLLPGEAERRFRLLHETPVDQHVTLVANHSARAVYAATGGRRATREELDGLRSSVLLAARDHGHPSPLRPAWRNSFDQRVARILHQQSAMVPGEAAQRQVWAFLALILLPDVCAWRWPADGQGRYTADRFKGTDLTRHALARLWTRAHVLHEPHTADPYALLSVLGEADLDQIMARRSALAGSPALVRAVVRSHRDEAAHKDASVPSRKVLRETLVRLLRLTAFVDLDAQSDDELDRLIQAVRRDARAALMQ
ncbi:DUF6339 family protein [Streptomyces sp. NPDC001135]